MTVEVAYRSCDTSSGLSDCNRRRRVRTAVVRTTKREMLWLLQRTLLLGEVGALCKGSPEPISVPEGVGVRFHALLNQAPVSIAGLDKQLWTSLTAELHIHTVVSCSIRAWSAKPGVSSPCFPMSALSTPAVVCISCMVSSSWQPSACMHLESQRQLCTGVSLASTSCGFSPGQVLSSRTYHMHA